jgi:hypothetical protein
VSGEINTPPNYPGKCSHNYLYYYKVNYEQLCCHCMLTDLTSSILEKYIWYGTVHA